MRFAIWANNWRKAVQHNLEAELKMHSYTMGVNKYSDMTNHEIRDVMNGYRMENKKLNSTSRRLFSKTFNAEVSHKCTMILMPPKPLLFPQEGFSSLRILYCEINRSSEAEDNAKNCWDQIVEFRQKSGCVPGSTLHGYLS